MTVAGGLAVHFTPEVALQQGEGCSFALARWLETVHNCTIGLTGVCCCGKQAGAKAWISPCVNVGLFPTPRGIGFFIRFLFNYLFDWLQHGKLFFFCWAGAVLDWGVDSGGDWERIVYHWHGPGRSRLPHRGHQRLKHRHKAQSEQKPRVGAGALELGVKDRGGRLWLVGEQELFFIYLLFLSSSVSVHQPPEVGQGWKETSVQTGPWGSVKPVEIIAVQVMSAEGKGKPSQSFQQLMVLVISTLVYPLLLLRRDLAYSSLTTIHEKNTAERHQNIPQSLLCKWGGLKLVS